MSNTAYVFAPATQPALPVRGEADLFPVHRIFCVGRNYAAHAQEMGIQVDKSKEAPMYFCKSAHSLQQSGGSQPYPPGTKNYHYEMELVVAIGAPAFRIDEARAKEIIYGYACGLDMTRRDLQAFAREHGHPWDTAKNFENAAVVSEIMPVATTGMIERGEISLRVNGEVKQQSDLSRMLWSIPELIATLSTLYHLQPGDIIFTGTPEGVGPVQVGDRLEGSVAGVGRVSLDIGPAE